MNARIVKQKEYVCTGLSYLAGAVACALVVPTASFASEKQIGDLEIFEAAKSGSATLMMMLDRSGSMSEVAVDYSTSCDTNYMRFNRTVTIKKDDGTDGDQFTYEVVGCYDYNNKELLTRLDRLKDALIPMFADPVKG